MTTGFGPDQVDQLLRDAGPGRIIHLVGAGGCGMSGLGHLLIDLGFQVVGSDLVVNDEVRQLQARGARLFSIHAGGNVDPDTLLVVFTSAVRPENPELQRAQELKIPAARRAVLLAALLHRQRGICVAGMHGKTTTAALLAFALDQLGLQPSYAIGALISQLKPHARLLTAPEMPDESRRPFFVIEADESDGTLREFHPHHAIVLNMDAEHLDHFTNLEGVIAEFGHFVGQTQGTVIFCADDPRLAELCARSPQAVAYGFHPLATYRAELEAAEGEALRGEGTQFDVWHKGAKLGSFRLRLYGQQNVSNATAVIAMLHRLGISSADIARAIAPFQGAARRQQELFRDHQVRVIEDYGHHPNEIRATLRAMRSLRPKRLVVAFQPHRFTRTQALWREFATCFSEADQLWLAELYPASEPEIPGINSGFLANAIRAQGQNVTAVLPLSRLGSAMLGEIQPGDLILFMGAGDITKAAHEMVATLRNASPDALRPTVESGSSPLRLPANPKVVMNTDLFAQLLPRLAPDSVVRSDEPLAKKTTLRVGGKADLYVEPCSESDLGVALQFCSEQKVPFLILGRGSNLLIRDGGVRGMVISLGHAAFSQVRVEGELLHGGAGARLKAVAIEARRQGLSGLEFLEGIPGSLGGALRMNAGAMGSWLFDIVSTIRFMDFLGTVHERRASEVNVEYRGCPLFKNHIALGATLRGQAASKEAIQARMDSFSRKRWESQPHQPSAGCIFKNPATIPAGKLIDELGLKGTRVGGAVVSDVHGNFIVNDGTATARDVLGLIEIIRQRAKSARGIELETEVEILGES